MDSSDDELLNNMATQWETSLQNPDETNPFSETATDIDSKDLPDSNSLKVLFQKFGHRKFRPLQWKIINSILKDKRDNCAVMTTGYGKSLCYQFPAVYSGGITLVISPLIALMEDQVLSLTIANIPSCLLGTAQRDTKQTLNDIFESKFSIIYLTPEFCTGDTGASILNDMQLKLKITLIAVDEAHCLSSWGHDFRTSYRKLGMLKNIFPTVPILAVTATATEQVKKDIIQILKLKNPQTLCSGFDRPNLYLSVKPKSNNILSDLKSLMTRQDGHWVFDGPTIIYVIRRKDTEEISNVLNNQNIACLPYHAGMTLKARTETHGKFVKDKISVVVATIAFGMGIDKPDIRNVIHYGTSNSIEGYYQEVGRGGRDGLPSKCVCFYASGDFQTHSFLIDQGRNPERKMKLLDIMKEYLHSRRCRREFILSYFEGNPNLSLPHRNNCCDNCSQKNNTTQIFQYEGLNDKGMFDFTDDAVIYLSAVDAMNGFFGTTAYILFLRGSRGARVPEKYRSHRCFGSGKDKSEDWWKAIANYLEIKHYLTQVRKQTASYSYSVYEVSKLGHTFLKQSTKTKLIDQPTNEILKHLKQKRQTSGWISADGSSVSNAGKASSVSNASIISRTSTLRKDDSGIEASDETQEQVDSRLKLFKLLKNCRTQLASANNCMPYMVASDFILMELAKLRPENFDELERLQIEGLTEARINKFGDRFLTIIRNNTPTRSESSKTDELSILKILEEHPLTDEKISSSCNLTYDYFKSSMPLQDIAITRGLALTRVISHLRIQLRHGYPIKLEALGVTPKTRCIILQVINNLGGQYESVTPIKEACPNIITSDQIQSVCDYLKVRDHLKRIGIKYYEFEDFVYNETSITPSVTSNTELKHDDNLNDDNDDLLSALCDEMEKQVETDETQDILNDIHTTTQLENKPSTSSDCSNFFPPLKKARSDDTVLDSPPRLSCEENEPKTEVVKNVTLAKKKLPQWLSKKKSK